MVKQTDRRMFWAGERAVQAFSRNQKQLGSSGAETEGLQRGRVRDGAAGPLRAWNLSEDPGKVPESHRQL